MNSAMHKSILSSVLLGAFVCCAATAQTAEPKTTQDKASTPQKYKDATDQLLETANESNTYLAKVCKLALNKSTNLEVKRLANQILRDHALGYRGAGMDETAAKVSDKAMTTEQMTMMTQLENAQENFDQLFLDQVVITLRDALANSQKYSGNDKLLKQSIANSIAADKVNLQNAQQLQGKLHGAK